MKPAELAQLHALCFETPRPWTEHEFTDLLAMTGVYCCKADRDGFAVGRLLLDECELLTLAVAPVARGRGLGRRLLADFETRARMGGARTALLEVSAENLPARHLYETQGYRHAGTRKGYYREPSGHLIDALVLSRDLG